MINNIVSNMSTTSHSESAELSARSVIVTAAGALAVAVATLVSLAHGWDYRFAVQAGCAITTLLAGLCWLELSPERIADRAAALLPGTPAGTLRGIYVRATLPAGLPVP